MMNWRRGLLRLWLLFSYIWIGSLSFISFNEFRAALTHREPIASEITLQSLVPFDCDASCQCWQHHCWSTISEFREKNEPENARMSDVELYVLLFDRAGIVLPGQRSLRTTLSKFAVLALGPPVGVLIFGAALMWAIKGFRPD